MSNKCKICGNGQANKFHTIKEMMFGTRHLFDYLECAECGTIQLLNPPDDFSAYYPTDYYAYTPLKRSGILRKIFKRIRWKLYAFVDIKPLRPLYGDWLKKAGAKTSDKIADMGCGNGQLLYEMYASGFKNLVGIDPYIKSDHKINASVILLKTSIFEIKETFDLIMMHHSFEHMYEPKKVLEKVNQLLKPGKKALIRIPLSDGKAWQIYGVHWAQLDAPRHIFIHTVKSIKFLAEQTGFEVSQIIYDSNAYQFWASEAITKNIPSTEAESRFSKKEMKDYQERANILNQFGEGDQACFYLTKK